LGPSDLESDAGYVVILFHDSIMRTHLLVLVVAATLADSLPAQTLAPEQTATLEWRLLGPSMPAGRAWTVTGVESDPRTLYVTTAGGGVWKTTNHGTTFEPIFNQEGAASTGAVAVAPSDPQIVWVGTGEPANTRANSWGDGVYRSTDAGATWTNMGLGDSYLISKIVIHPTDPDRVWVAAMGHLWGTNAERGVFRTTDGGRSWDKVLFVNDTTGAMDLEIDPHDPNTLYASTWQRLRFGGGDMDEAGPGSGIWKSVDGGTSWRRLTAGLPTEDMGKIHLTVARGDSRVVYAGILTREPRERAGSQTGVYRSTDGGEHWSKMSDPSTGYYYQNIFVDPTNDDRVYMPVFELTRSDNGGASWEKVNMRHVHDDLHGMWIDPSDADHFVLVGDGGVNITFDGGASWNASALPIGQFYDISVDRQDPWHVIGGMQDTGHWLGPSRTYDEDGITDEDWDKLRYNGDGMASATDPRDPNIVYLVQEFGNASRLDLRSWARTELQPTKEELAAVGIEGPVRYNWTPAFVLSEHDPDYVYLGGNYLFRIEGKTGDVQRISPDLTWQQDRSFLGMRDGYHSYGTLFSVAESHFSAEVLWAGADDGPIWVTEDLGGHWRQVDGNIPDAPEQCVVAEIETSRFDPAVAYVALDCHARDDHAPYLYRTGDMGRSWTSVAGGLADGPSYVIREDPANPDVLYVGAEHGVYASLDRGAHWAKLGRGLPTAGVRALVVQARDRDLVAGTFGRAIWTVDIGPMAEMADALAEPLHLFPVEPGTKFRWRVTYGNTIEELNGDEMFRAENPPLGTAISYAVGGGGAGSAEIVIRDAGGSVVRTLEGPAEAGIHRVWWDLRSDVTANAAYTRGAGMTPSEWAYRQLVGEGTYRVTVRVGGREVVRSVKVRDEPVDGVGQAPMRR
jgi:photosystem II stability/assembly factor-like uncharacterized protein